LVLCHAQAYDSLLAATLAASSVVLTALLKLQMLLRLLLSHQLCTIRQGYVVLKASGARVEFSATRTRDAFQHNIILANGAKLAAGSVALHAVVKVHVLLLHHERAIQQLNTRMFVQCRVHAVLQAL
jgi:hypothetical protein